MKGPMGDLLRQAQELQARLARMQQELEALDVQGESGGGLVRVVMSGRHQVKRLDIDGSLYGDDRTLLPDLVAAAFNDASRRVDLAVQERMRGVQGGLGMPFMPPT